MYSQILVPLDGSKLSERALPHAQGLAKPSGATVHLLHIFTHHPSGGYSRSGLEEDRPFATSSEIARQLEEAQINDAQEYLEHISTQLQSEGLKTVNEIEEGSPHDHIVDYAKKHSIDLIVMTTHGHGGLRRMLTGSTTDRVVRAGEVPVLVIPCS